MNENNNLLSKEHFRFTIEQALINCDNSSGELSKALPSIIVNIINQHFRAIKATIAITSKQDVVAKCLYGGMYCIRCYWASGPSLSIREYDDPYDAEIYGVMDAEEELHPTTTCDVNYESRLEASHQVLMKFIGQIDGTQCLMKYRKKACCRHVADGCIVDFHQ